MIVEMIVDVFGVVGGVVGGVGIVLVGFIDLYSGCVSLINIGFWGGFLLWDWVVVVVLGVLVWLGGDGVCMVFGEYWLGVGWGVCFLLGLVVFIGVGGGLVFDGVFCFGCIGNVGYVGYVVVDLDGLLCLCGGCGCVEIIVFGLLLVCWVWVNGWFVLFGVGVKELVEVVGVGDLVVLWVFCCGVVVLVVMIVLVGVVCDLDFVVIGGGVVKLGCLLFELLCVVLVDYVWLDFLVGLWVVFVELGGVVGLVGVVRFVVIV